MAKQAAETSKEQKFSQKKQETQKQLSTCEHSSREKGNINAA